MQNVAQSDLEQIMGDSAVRDSVILNVLDTPQGQLLLAYFGEIYKYAVPDTSNPYDTYFHLGQRSVIESIRTMIKRAKEIK